MTDILNEIESFFRTWKSNGDVEIETLKQAGSNRQYFRVHYLGQKYIVTHNPNNIPENHAFIEFTRHFSNLQLPVPEILYINKDRTTYLQSDLGEVSLFHIMQNEGFSNRVYDLFRKSLSQLA